MRIASTFGTALLITVLGAISYHWVEMSKSRAPAVEIEKYALESSEVTAGKDLIVKFTMSRNEKCLSVSTLRTVVNNANDTQAWGSSVQPKTLDVGRHQTGVAVVRVPDEIPEGDYRFQAFTFNSDCPEGRSYIVVSPVLNFRVVK